MNKYSVSQLFSGVLSTDTEVTIKGWVRSRRTSKAGISFIEVHDGSCFAPMQVVAAETLVNYQDEILNISTGCAVEVTGQLVESQGQGQSVEIQAEAVKVVGWVENPETYPMAKKTSYL